MILTFKYRIEPTKKQAYALGDVLFQMQTVYNDALNERRWYWSRSRKSITYYDQWNRIREERKANPEEMGMLNVTSVMRTLRRVDQVCQRFYKGQAGPPRFKGRNRFKSVTYVHGDGCKLKGTDPGPRRLYIQHVGDIKIRLHRPLPEDAKIKTVVIKRKNNKWDVCFQIELPDPWPVPHLGPAVGVDVGLLRLLTLSDETEIDNPRWLRQSLAKKRVLNRKLARQKRYGAGWRKTAHQIAKLDEHIANQRRDFWHKETRKLVTTYSTIVIEDLNLVFMTRNGNLSLSAHDAALGMFRQMIEYKAVEAGARVIAVNPSGTSQACSGCGVIVKKSLRVRVHHCADCGLTLDRDVNAARNILSRGRRDESLTWPVAVCVGSEAPSL